MNEETLLPLSDITFEAKELAIKWMGAWNNETDRFNNLQQLASDIIIYARRHSPEFIDGINSAIALIEKQQLGNYTDTSAFWALDQVKEEIKNLKPHS